MRTLSATPHIQRDVEIQPGVRAGIAEQPHQHRHPHGRGDEARPGGEPGPVGERLQGEKQVEPGCRPLLVQHGAGEFSLPFDAEGNGEDDEQHVDQREQRHRRGAVEAGAGDPILDEADEAQAGERREVDELVPAEPKAQEIEPDEDHHGDAEPQSEEEPVLALPAHRPADALALACGKRRGARRNNRGCVHGVSPRQGWRGATGRS